MKKFSTAVLLLLLALAPQAMAKARCEFLSTAPDSHRVKAGDTLWQIAVTFLENPWCWTQVWEINRAHIRDPHWIYPGQTIHFDRERRRLSLLPNDAITMNRRSPSLRTETLRAEPLPVLPAELRQRLDKATLVSAESLANTPRVAGLSDGRRMASAGDTIFVSGTLEGHTLFQIIRPLQAIADPQTNQVLALSSLRIGKALLEKTASETMHQFRVSSSDTEIRIGDQLVPWIDDAQKRWVPHPAKASIAAQVAAVLHGATWASTNDIVAINRGAQHGLEAGSVVAVVRHVKIPVNDSPQAPGSFAPEEIADLLVFDVTDTAALAIVMRARNTFTIGDAVESVDRNAR